MDTAHETLKAALEAIRDMASNALTRLDRPKRSVRCDGGAKRASMSSISQSLRRWKPLADALEAKTQNSDLCGEEFSDGVIRLTA
jgi:hypothetical protein